MYVKDGTVAQRWQNSPRYNMDRNFVSEVRLPHVQYELSELSSLVTCLTAREHSNAQTTMQTDL